MAKRNGDEEFGNGFAKVLNSGIHNKIKRIQKSETNFMMKHK